MIGECTISDKKRLTYIVKYVKLYRIVWIIAVFFGAIVNLSVVWTISDIMNALMAIPNLISLLLLSGIIAKETKHYLWDNHLNDRGN